MFYLSELLKPNKFNALIWFQFILFVVLLLAGQINAINFVVIYFLESIIIGFFHFFFLLSLKNQPLDSDGNRVFISIFFLIHYMFFIFVQSVFLFNIIGHKIPEIDNSFNVLKKHFHYYSYGWDATLNWFCFVKSKLSVFQKVAASQFL